MKSSWWSLPALALASLSSTAQAAPCPSRSLAFAPRQLRVIEKQSGPVNYYRVVDDPKLPFIRAAYKPRYKTTVLGAAAPEADRGRVRKLAWSWRALTLPKGGDECADGKGDSAAVVYVSWKRGLRWYTLKYVWSSVGKPGRVCDRKRNPFVAQDTIIVQSGGPLNTWKSQEIDLRAEFRKHFEDGNPDAEVPDFAGFAIMSDGDQTGSESSADYAGFTLTLDPVCPK